MGERKKVLLVDDGRTVGILAALGAFLPSKIMTGGPERKYQRIGPPKLTDKRKSRLLKAQKSGGTT